ncbi:sigma-70 family RNA polymerase sigma factor [Anaerobacillus isosaccharinicus]|uniref:Sigma-70 family RNA polymerase sigma factor n=2 Tax=Anaerobacillus isosaccharinicus TaxID=1532552 RepID=A0A7S7LC98_9BACI|nr:sigma-70 family RNA polymerase sigma factor [Anaerobacillus isosaccharinicus]
MKHEVWRYDSQPLGRNNKGNRGIFGERAFRWRVSEMNRSFEEIVEAFTPLVKKQIRQLHGTKHFDELYQIGLIAIWEASERFSGEKGHFPSYVKKYIRGKMLHFLNKEKKIRERTVMFDEPEIIEQLPAQAATVVMTIPLRPVLSYLSDREKLWLVEHLEHGKGPKQIAKEHNVSVNTVKTWRLEAIKKLKLHLNTPCDGTYVSTT